jgi:dTDP-4-dehydrorhamnose reductase
MHKPQLADHLIGDRPQLKILLLGKDGQLGQELQRALAPLGTLTAWGRETADLVQPAHWIDLVFKLQPDVIINAAAYTAVDKAESEPALAHAINAAAPAALANAAKQLGAHLVHYSTDYVFDGSGQTPWRESDAASPLNVYGASKLAGEQAISASGCNYWIFRTSWVYAKAGGNFAKTMLRLAAEREYLSVIDDQWGAPTDAAWLADITASALQANTLVASGIYHAVCAGETSWHGYASYLIARARSMGFPIKALPEAIRAVASTAFPTPAQRPHNSRLDCSQLQTHFGITPPPWQRGIDELLEHLFDQTLTKA